MTRNLPTPFMRFDIVSYPSGYETKIDETQCLEPDIESVIKCCDVSRDKAIYSLIECGNEVKKAILYCSQKQYELKFEAPENGIYSIIGIPTMDECRIFSKNGRPVVLSDIASEHYGVKTLDDIVGKSVCVFRRFKDEQEFYEFPYKYYLQKATIVEFTRTIQLNMANAVIRTEGETETEEVRIQRVCIDWEA